MKAVIACSAIGAALVLSACGKPTLSASQEATSDVSADAAAASPCNPYADINCGDPTRAGRRPAEKNLPQANRQTPDSAYIKIDSGNQLMFLYYGLSGLPPDYETIAGAYSQDYRNTSDAFRKQDIMTVLKPRIDSGIDSAKTQRYFIYEIGRPDLQHYDFASKSFAMNNMAAGYTWYVSDNSAYKLEFTNADAFHKLAVDDETVARKLEGLVSRYPGPSLVVYGYAQDIDLNQKLVKAQITKVVLRDAQGNALTQN